MGAHLLTWCVPICIRGMERGRLAHVVLLSMQNADMGRCKI